MSTRNTLMNIINHTYSLGIIDTVKIETSENTNNVTKITTTDPDKTVVVDAVLNHENSDFDGVIGLVNMSVLKGYLELPNNKSDDAVIAIKHRERNGESFPEAIVITDDRGVPSTYRLPHPDILPKTSIFKGVEWDITFTPSKSALAEFAQRASVLSSFEQYFRPSVAEGQLRFNIGDMDNADYATYSIMSDEMDGISYNSSCRWPIDRVLKILKLDTENKAVINISERGALQIEMETDDISWKYILPALTK